MKGCENACAGYFLQTMVPFSKNQDVLNQFCLLQFGDKGCDHSLLPLGLTPMDHDPWEEGFVSHAQPFIERRLWSFGSDTIHVGRTHLHSSVKGHAVARADGVVLVHGERAPSDH